MQYYSVIEIKLIYLKDDTRKNKIDIDFSFTTDIMSQEKK